MHETGQFVTHYMCTKRLMNIAVFLKSLIYKIKYSSVKKTIILQDNSIAIDNKFVKTADKL